LPRRAETSGIRPARHAACDAVIGLLADGTVTWVSSSSSTRATDSQEAVGKIARAESTKPSTAAARDRGATPWLVAGSGQTQGFPARVRIDDGFAD
jgi:hypothetical protein